MLRNPILILRPQGLFRFRFLEQAGPTIIPEEALLLQHQDYQEGQEGKQANDAMLDPAVEEPKDPSAAEVAVA